ncbi:MAG TPA: S41 family peptidase [Acidobacteriota bacterium]
MRKKFYIVTLSGFLVLFLSIGALLARSNPRDKTYSYLTIFSNILHLVDANYVEEVDFNKVMDSAMYGMVENLDPESFFVKGTDVDEYKKELEENKSKAGVGISVSKRFGLVSVIAVEKGSSAYENKIKAGDSIRSVNDQYVQELPIYKIDNMLNGPPGTQVKISLFKGANEKPENFTLVRRAITKPYIESFVAQPRIGYIRIVHLLPGVETEIEKKLADFQSQGIDRLILDVRSCVEDIQDPAVKVADLFLPQTTIVQISGRDGVVQKISGDSKVAFKGQLLILADFTTAGGAEIVAGAIQDAGAGKVLGIRTYGRGGIQKLLPAGGNYIVLTTQKYVTPKGKVILNNGIDPAMPFKDDLKTADTKPDEDRMLNKAIDYFRHPAA